MLISLRRDFFAKQYVTSMGNISSLTSIIPTLFLTNQTALIEFMSVLWYELRCGRFLQTSDQQTSRKRSFFSPTRLGLFGCCNRSLNSISHQTRMRRIINRRTKSRSNIGNRNCNIAKNFQFIRDGTFRFWNLQVNLVILKCHVVTMVGVNI